MSDHDDDQLVTDYLRRLTAAASALPADRRAELTEEITAHIAEARAAGPANPGGSPCVPDILERLGDPAHIARAAAEPFPGGRQPEPQRPPAPASVRNAVRLMYLGAAASLTKVILDLATESTTRSAMLSALKTGIRKSGGVLPTASQFSTGFTDTLAMAAVLGLIGAGLWIFVAREQKRQGLGAGHRIGTVRPRHPGVAHRPAGYGNPRAREHRDQDLRGRRLADRAGCGRVSLAEGLQRLPQGPALPGHRAQ